MSDLEAASMKPNWLFLVVGLAGLAALTGLLWPRNAALNESGETGVTADMQSGLRQIFEQNRELVREPQEAKVQRDIEQHRAKVEEDPQAPDAAGYLNAMGNLYRQKLGDYASAAEAFERIIVDHPNWQGTYAVYPQLEVCYEQLADDDGLRWLYGLMMQRFPPESQEYQYAQRELGLR